MALTDHVIYCTVFAGVILWMALYAIVERGKLAGLPSGMWLALRALLWVALLAVWAPVAASIVGLMLTSVPTAASDAVGLEGSGLLSAGGAAVSLCIAVGVTIVSAYLYRNLWQLGAVQPRLRRRAEN